MWEKGRRERERERKIKKVDQTGMLVRKKELKKDDVPGWAMARRS